MNRRELLKQFLSVGGMALATPLIGACQKVQNLSNTKTQIAFVKTNDRVKGISQAIDLLHLPKFKKKDLFIKPNFNSADETPGSTHLDTLKTLISKLREMESGKLTIGDRSGMGNTNDVFENKKIFALGKENDVNTIVFDTLKKEDWEFINFDGSHWKQGFYIPKAVKNSGGIIQTCCLKTHRYGGHFTLSLKNSVGLAAKRVPENDYNFMSELHGSPNQRTMIAEINTAYKPDLIVLDGVDAFTTGGPDSGKQVNSSVVLAGTDRIAIDAIGVAILRYFGTTDEVSKGKIFEQAQIARAVELNLGINSPNQIEFVTNDAESAKYAKEIQAILNG
ncbi:MAG TPA: DUF362 domain-containing protein [Pyrinomonadaceae bacterium]|nr:DUF362 domain-containing protein [Pyrinomonadaceae bacterium]